VAVACRTSPWAGVVIRPAHVHEAFAPGPPTARAGMSDAETWRAAHLMWRVHEITVCHRPLTFLAARAEVDGHSQSRGRTARRAGAPRHLAQWSGRVGPGRRRAICFTGRVAMICPDCQRNLDDVPVGDPCPQCGGGKRSAVVQAGAALVGVEALTASVSIGYSLTPGWAYQWRIIQRHLARLREQYQGIDTRGNVDVEETVHALFLSLFHLGDWLHQDSALSSTAQTVKAWIDQHPGTLGLCRDYANTWKHMVRNQATARIAQITAIESGQNGYIVTIGYRHQGQPQQPMTPVDALDLAEQSEQDWRGFLAAHSISIPT
jgi:hypothetical protein